MLRQTDCPLTGLEYEISSPNAFTGQVLGFKGEGEPDVRTVTIRDNRDTTCRTKVWKEKVSMPNGLWELLNDLFGAYWKPYLRTESAGFPDLKREAEARKIAQNTVESYAEAEPLSLLYCDLDHFKSVNDLRQSVGDQVIKEFGALLESVCHKQAILLHDGGDEFIVLLPGSVEEALMLAYEVEQAVEEYDFKIPSPTVKLTASIGIVTTEATVAAAFDELADVAYTNALKGNAKKRSRCARFPNEYRTSSETTCTLLRSLNVAYCIVKSGIGVESPFANVWLNCISFVVAKKIREDPSWLNSARDSINAFLDWAGLEILPTAQGKPSQTRADDGIDGTPAVTPLGIAFAIAHGSMRALFEKNGRAHEFHFLLKYDEACTACALVLNGDVLWNSGHTVPLAEEYDMGNSWEVAQSCESDSSDQTGKRRAILIQVGHEKPPLPSIIFTESIVVDDRPTRGGGLPDFWEATIARLISAVRKNENIAAVYVMGNHEYAVQTIRKLRQVDAWSSKEEEISYRTGMQVGDVRWVADRLKGRIVLPSNDEELVAHLAEVLKAKHIVKPTTQRLSYPPLQFLRRPIDSSTMTNIALSREDGCRVETIAKAYPLVLDIIRQTDRPPVKDQAGLFLKELIDFKVNLTSPMNDMIPFFYKDEEESFRRYFHDQFLSSSGLFGQQIEKTGQKEAIVKHVAGIVSDPRQQFSTRRAIIVIPHEIKDDLAPLGLVAVRCIPRFVGSCVRLNYTCSWRTVEALVGFPYSIYGSVMYSQHLTDEIRGQLQTKLAGKVEMGEVSYIAHSLHIFIDDYGQRIAKRIVEDASF